MENLLQLSEETKLIQQCVKGNPIAQKRLYQQYMNAMYNRALRMVGEEEMAKDIVQEVFLEVFKNLKNFRGEARLGAWIKRITINTSLNYLRKNRKIQWVSLENVEDTITEVNKRELDIKKIHQAIRKLPVGCRTVLNLYLIEGYQHKEIAQILGISVSTSKTQYQRAKALVRSYLETELSSKK